MTEQFANLAQSSLAKACGTNDTTIFVANASTFPAIGNFRIIVQMFDASGLNPISNPELMIVTAVGGNGAFTVTRGAENTTPIAFRSGARVTHIITAAVMKLFLQNITGLITQGSNITITGSGTSGSPYVISSTGGGGGSISQATFFMIG